MTELHGFELIEERDVAEVNSHARLFRHIKTGAELLSLENDDENKSFMIAFRTPPADSTGLPHIMEHSVLCGSRKYPVKDPFANLIKTSLNTFLNAFTASDATYYPVASANLKDFYNLVDVYLDAVFFPLIPEETLKQEGWHLEVDNGELAYRGIVFNEMKSYYATPEVLLDEVSQAALLPDTPYANSSGGNPAFIPDLTYQQFKSFHETYYHPSNARIVFSGDDDPTERLRIANEYLSQFEAREINSELPLQPRFNEPRRTEKTYDAGDADADSKKTLVTVRWLLPEITERRRMTELRVLSYALVGTSASPLHKILMDSNLGEDLTGSGFNARTRQADFEIGLKGSHYSDADQIEALILETLGNLAEDGIDEETVEAALNTIEFNLRERNTGGFPRGLAAAVGAYPLWAHGGNPLDALQFEEDLAYVRQQFAEDEHYFQNLIGEYFVNNTHRSTVILRPDPQEGQRIEEAEKSKLAAIREQLNDDDLTRIIEQQEALRIAQATPDSPEDLAKLPRLTTDDIEREVKVTDQEIHSIEGVNVYFHEQPTAGIAYVDLGFDLFSLPPHLVPYLGLFGKALKQMGTETQDFVQLIQRIGRTTGGINASLFNTVARDHTQTVNMMFVRAKVMKDQTESLLDLLRDMLFTLKLDHQERFSQLVRERRARFEQPGPFTPTGWTLKRLRAHFNEADWADEQIGGVSQLFFLRELSERVEQDWESVLADLETIRKTLLNKSNLVVNATMEADGWAAFQPQITRFIADMPDSAITTHPWQTANTATNEGMTMPLRVNFVGKGAQVYNYGYEMNGSISVVLKHMNMDYMWNRIRMQGGAYGGSAIFDPNSGALTFMSWSDPNLVESLNTYDQAAAYLRELALSEEDLEQAIIGTIGDLDGQDLPDAKGFKALIRHLMGYTTELRQQYRDEMLATTLEDFKKVADVLEKVAVHGHVVVTGSPDALEKANQTLDPQLTLTKITG